jgi:hypothetical protein
VKGRGDQILRLLRDGWRLQRIITGVEKSQPARASVIINTRASVDLVIFYRIFIVSPVSKMFRSQVQMDPGVSVGNRRIEAPNHGGRVRSCLLEILAGSFYAISIC